MSRAETYVIFMSETRKKFEGIRGSSGVDKEREEREREREREREKKEKR